jgi:tetratricopeptide (TPR) repeat protein
MFIKPYNNKFEALAINWIIKLFIALLFCCCYQNTFAQKKIKEKEFQADGYYSIGDYYTSLNLYLELFTLDSTNSKYPLRIGSCMFLLKQSSEQILHYLNIAASKKEPEAYYYLGKVYHLQERFEDEISAYRHYLNISGNHPFTSGVVLREIELAKYAKEALQNPITSTVLNMGPEINSEYADYAPLISADENTLIFTSRRSESVGGKKDELGNYFEDIYFTNRENKKWNKAQNLGSPVNTPTNDASTGLSPDGQNLLIYRTQPNKFDGDLYVCNYLNKVWSDPKKLNENINSNFVETSACISLDNQIMYFSSNRPGGQGGKDLYMSRLLPDGQWGKPINLGPSINTPFDEDAPFIHPDGKTLYFSSKGHNTIGGFDVYFTVLGDDDFWSEPSNLGYPINTTDDDIFFVLSTDGKRGYLAGKRKDSYGSYDIYQVNFRGSNQTNEVMTGRISEEGSDKIPVTAKITVIEEEGHVVSGIYNNNSKTGKFIFLINPNKHYKIIIEASGYNTIVRTLDGLSYPSLEGSELVFMMTKIK